ncbi:MAG: tetratricopeptide repeat protein [Treponema sp.]|nr:tetratricopeptide repeat protein [Treponema sp.]
MKPYNPDRQRALMPPCKNASYSLNSPWYIPVLVGIILLWTGCGTTEPSRTGRQPAPRGGLSPMRPEQTPPAAVPETPDALSAYFNAGFAHYEAGEYPAAIADFTRALAIKNNDTNALFYRAKSYDYLKDYDQAIEDWTALLRLHPHDAEVYYNRGNAYCTKKDYDQAIADYNQAIRIQPNYAEAHYNQGIAYNNKGDYDQAIAAFNQAIKIQPHYAEAYNNRGFAYVNKKDYAHARADWTEALRLNPNYTIAQNNLDVLRQQGH